MYYQRTLSNGIRVVGQTMEHVRSISVGIWAQTGSANELHESERGITHFIEHMLFKGTNSRTAQQIAQEFDQIGGILNAFTSKECTCYHARVSSDKLDKTLDVLVDLVRNATLDEGEMKKEKGVVIEEINMSQDMPEDLVHDLLSTAYFGDHPLALPILGNHDSVSGFTNEGLRAYLDRRYRSNALVVSAAGGFDFEALCELVERLMGDMAVHTEPIENFGEFTPQQGKLLMKVRPVEQAHLCLAMPGVSLDDERTYAMAVMNNAFGGGMSSRLFQIIREENGLAYDIYSHPSAYQNCGVFSIYTGVNAKLAGDALQLIFDTINNTREKGLSEEEFVRAREQLKGNYVLGLESTSARMNAIGKSVTLLNKLTPEDEVIAKIEAVTMEQVNAVLPYVFDNAKVSVSAAGKIDEALLQKIYDGRL